MSLLWNKNSSLPSSKLVYSNYKYSCVSNLS